MNPSLKATAVVALLSGAVLVAAPALASNRAHVRKRVRARCELSPETPLHVHSVPLAEGARVSVTLRKARRSDLVPNLRLLCPDGTEFRPLDLVSRETARGLDLPTFSVPPGEAGTWSFVVGSEAGSGVARLSVRVHEPRAATLRPRELPAGRTEVLPLSVLPGRDLAWRVHGTGVSVELVDPEGASLSTDARGRVSVRRAGIHELRITASETASTRISAALRTRRGSRALGATDVAIPDGFRFATTRRVPVSVALSDPDGAPLAGVVVSLQTVDRQVLHRGRTDADGRFAHDLDLSAEIETLRIVVSTIGLAADHVVPVTPRIELVVD